MTAPQASSLSVDGSAWSTPTGLYILGCYTGTSPAEWSAFLANAEAHLKTIAQLHELRLAPPVKHQQIEVYDLPQFARRHARMMLAIVRPRLGKGFQLTRVWQDFATAERTS